MTSFGRRERDNLCDRWPGQHADRRLDRRRDPRPQIPRRSQVLDAANACDDDDDGDGLPDVVETNTGVFVDVGDTGTDPLLADSDADGLGDDEEVSQGSDPNDAASPGVSADADGDGDDDMNDVNLILASRNVPAVGLFDPRDLDGDGMITALDARKAILLCSQPRCAVSGPAGFAGSRAARAQGAGAAPAIPMLPGWAIALLAVGLAVWLARQRRRTKGSGAPGARED